MLHGLQLSCPPTFKWRMAIHGSQNVCEWIRTIKNYTLSGYAEKINCPVLVCYPQQEHLAPGQVNLLPQALTSAQSIHTIFLPQQKGQAVIVKLALLIFLNKSGGLGR